MLSEVLKDFLNTTHLEQCNIHMWRWKTDLQLDFQLEDAQILTLMCWYVFCDLL